jgi:hypothetical protein
MRSSAASGRPSSFEVPILIADARLGTPQTENGDPQASPMKRLTRTAAPPSGAFLFARFPGACEKFSTFVPPALT